MFGAEGLDELDVFGLGACLVEDAKVGLSLIEGLGGLTQTTSKTVVNLCVAISISTEEVG